MKVSDPRVTVRLFDPDQGKLKWIPDSFWREVTGRVGSRMIGFYELFWYVVELDSPLNVPGSVPGFKGGKETALSMIVVAPVAIKTQDYETPQDAIGDAMAKGVPLIVGVSACLDCSEPLPSLDVRNPADHKIALTRFPYLCSGELRILQDDSQ